MKPINVIGLLPEAGREAAKVLLESDSNRFGLTDLGNAERLVRDHGADLHYCPPRRKWLVWSGTHWQVDETGEVTRQAKATVRSIYAEAAGIADDDRRGAIIRHATGSERAPRIAAMIELAQSEPGVAVMPAELDSDPWLLCCSNGTVDLRTGELRPHRREDLITRTTGVTYDPEARSELWDGFLVTATGGDVELAAYLQRAVGCSLPGMAAEKAFFFAFGEPDTSKSTFIAAVSAALGGYHQAASPETWLVQSSTGGNRGDLVRLAGARMVSSVELRKGAKLDEAIIKQVTGGDEITAAAKYEADVSFHAAFTLWLAANDCPTVRDDDAGMWARVRRIPFRVVIPKEKQDKDLRVKLRAPDVQAAVLTWAVQGCMAWQANGLHEPKAVEKSTAEYRAESDRAEAFFDGQCVFGGGLRVSAKELRRAYVGWCEETGIHPLSPKDLASRLGRRNCSDGKSGAVRYWEGVRLVDSLLDQVGTPGTPRDTTPREFFHDSPYEGTLGNRRPMTSQRPTDEREEYEAEEAWRGAEC